MAKPWARAWTWSPTSGRVHGSLHGRRAARSGGRGQGAAPKGRRARISASCTFGSGQVSDTDIGPDARIDGSGGHHVPSIHRDLTVPLLTPILTRGSLGRPHRPADSDIVLRAEAVDLVRGSRLLLDHVTFKSGPGSTGHCSDQTALARAHCCAFWRPARIRLRGESTSSATSSAGSTYSACVPG